MTEGKPKSPKKRIFWKPHSFFLSLSFFCLGGGGYAKAGCSPLHIYSRNESRANQIFVKFIKIYWNIFGHSSATGGPSDLTFRFKLIMKRILGENDLIWEIMADLANRQLGCDQVVAIHLERRDYKTSEWGVLILGRWTQCRNCSAPSWASSWSWWGEVLQAGCRWAQQHHLGLLAVSALVAGLSVEHSLLLHQRSLLMPLAWNFTIALLDICDVSVRMGQHLQILN